MRIHYLQHVPFEDLANIAPWAKARGHTIAGTALYAGEALPALEAVDWLIVLGGPMGVGDTRAYPWLQSEKAFVREAIDAGRLVLGICLGAQLIADALGAKVRRNVCKEVGWHPVTLTEAGEHSPLFQGVPKAFMAFHWHGETFEIPAGAQHIATSPACLNQGFTYGDRVLGLQFHLETSEAAAERLIAHCPEDLADGDYSQSADEIRRGMAHSAAMQDAMTAVLDNMEAQGS
jgi:GMP synthase (glutamine-hydrolysing)